ncbi:hypothetical protein H0H93_008776 [Arthromyces matolae]|nr:hypothetical protein H0H93_008776 [Arthromyces matolae]
MAPSPDPALYRRWCRRRGAVIWGMDLWTSEELLNGLQVQQTYPAFEEGLKSLLQGCLDGSSNQSLEIRAAIRAAKILKHHTENTLATGDSVALPVTSSKSNSLAMSLNDALRVLIDNAVQLYGPIAQEVFNAVLHFNPPKNYLALLDIATLKTIVNHAQDCNFDAIEISHSTVLRVQPIPPQHQRLSLWEIAFQSDWVAKKAFQQMQDLTPSDLRSHFSVYNRTDSATSTLAGQLFEMTSHLLLCRGEFDYHYHEMQMTNIDKVGSSNSAVYSDQPSGIVPKRKEQRDVIRFNNESLQRQLVESKSGDYFLPDLTYYPFYDAFFYEQIGDETTLYILQTSSASDHRGSSQGYGSIRHITHFLRTGHHLNGKGVDAPQSKRYRMEVDVTIKYMLVYPFEEGKPCHGNPSWQMPQGWDEFNQQKDLEELVKVKDQVNVIAKEIKLDVEMRRSLDKKENKMREELSKSGEEMSAVWKAREDAEYVLGWFKMSTGRAPP